MRREGQIDGMFREHLGTVRRRDSVTLLPWTHMWYPSQGLIEETRCGVDLEPHPRQPGHSVMSTSTAEFRPGASPLSRRRSPAEEQHLAQAWPRGALEGSQALAESEQLSPLPLSALVLAWLWTDPTAPHGLSG